MLPFFCLHIVAVYPNFYEHLTISQPQYLCYYCSHIRVILQSMALTNYLHTNFILKAACLMKLVTLILLL
jgi:hypothetical protein